MRSGPLVAALWLGALYDVAVALALVIVPERLARALDLAPPEPVYLRLIAVFLLILAAVYVLAALQPEGRAALSLVAVFGRLAGAAVLLGEWAVSSRAGFLPLGAADFAFGLAVAAGLGWWRRGPAAS